MVNLNKLIGRVVVVDASILIKMYLHEPEYPLVKKLFQYAKAYKLTVLAPFLLRYELFNIIARKLYDLNKITESVDMLNDLKIGFVDPGDVYLKNALKEVFADQKISFYDAAYGALAKEFNGVFLTADKKYYEKMKGKVEMVLM